MKFKFHGSDTWYTLPRTAFDRHWMRQSPDDVIRAIAKCAGIDHRTYRIVGRHDSYDDTDLVVIKKLDPDDSMWCFYDDDGNFTYPHPAKGKEPKAFSRTPAVSAWPTLARVGDSS